MSAAQRRGQAVSPVAACRTPSGCKCMHPCIHACMHAHARGSQGLHASSWCTTPLRSATFHACSIGTTTPSNQRLHAG
eukprot:236387-Chlamydomonas_euryale.AAC.4